MAAADDLGPTPQQQDDDGLGPQQQAAQHTPSSKVQDDGLGPSEQDSLGPETHSTPDLSAMKDYVSKNINSYKQSQDQRSAALAPGKKTYADNFGEALLAGLQSSSSGLLVNGAPTTILPENAGRAMRVMTQAGQMLGDVPEMLLGGIGGFVAGGGNPVTAAAGAFSTPMALRKILMDHYEKGDIKSPSDFVDRLMGTAWEATKGAVTGAATALTGGLASPIVGTLGATAAELGVMTTVGAGLEGRFPHSDEFLDGALLLGGLHGVMHIAPKLRNIYAATGDRPSDVIQAAEKDVQLKQDLLSPDPNVPEIAQPTELKHEIPETNAEEQGIASPTSELIPRKPPEDKLPAFERTPEEKEILSKLGVSAEPVGSDAGQKFDSWYARNIDFLDQLKPALKEAQANGANVLPENNSYIKGRLFAAHPDTIRSFLEFGTRDGKTDQINGEGLNAIYRDVPNEDMDGYRAYGIAKRAIELDERGIVPYAGFNKDIAKKVISDGADKYEQINQRRIGFENRVLDFMKDKGLFTEENIEKIKQVNQEHFPLNRAQDADLYTGKVKGGAALKRIYGSEKSILDPVLQTYKNTEAFIRKALVNDVRRSFVDVMRKGGLLEERGQENPEAYLSKVNKKLIPTEVSSEELAHALQKQGFDGIEPEAITIFRPEKSFLKDNQIAIWEDGKAQIYEGPPGVIDSLKRLDGDATSIDIWSKTMRGFANATRIGVIANPGFGVSHFFRSQIMSSVYSKTGMIPFFHSAMAIKELMGASSKDYQDWLYHGGASSSWFRIEDDYLKDNAIEKNEKEAPVHGRAWNAIHTAMDATEAFIKLTDNASRFAEYKRSVAKGVSPQEAAFRSREVVPDYQKAGLERSALRTGVAFIGAHINSLDRMVQSFQEDPKSTIAKLSVISTVSAMLWAVNKGDKAIDALPDWQKDQYWNFNITRLTGGGSSPNKPATIVRLPKPWAPGILFGSGVEVALDHFTKDSPNRTSHFINTLTSSVIPEPIPNVAQPILEQWANRNKFTGRPLVNEALEKQLPEMQYAPYTDESAKQIAKLIGYVPLIRDIGPKGQNVPLQSPLVVENYIRAWGGTVGGWALKIADLLINQEKKNQISKSNLSPEEKAAKISTIGVDRADPWQNTAILHSFVSRYPSFSDQNVQDFYDNKAEADKVMNSIHGAAKKGDADAAQRIMQEHPDLLLKLDGISKAISTAKQTYSIIQDDPKKPAVEKRQILDTILFQVGEMAKQGNNMISDFKKRSRGTIGQGE